MNRCVLLRFLLLFLFTTPGARPAAPPRPYMLWTEKESAAARERIQREPWAAAAYAQLLADQGPGKTYRNLFRYVVMGDRGAGEAEKKYLLGIIGTHPRQFEKLEHGGRHFDCYLDALRYDSVHDLLSPEERAKLEDTFRAYIAYQLEDKHVYNRVSWLPNMQWPRPLAAHLLAVALGDEPLIRALVNGNGGWKYYFDDYIADGQFYFEEFGKQYSMVGEMLLFCRGLERLGLDSIGYGYTGKGGATMRRYLEGIVQLGYPRIDLPGGLPQYPRVTMGDAKGAALPVRAFQHANVTGFLADGTGGNELYRASNMNGRDHRQTKVDKLMTPHWFEIAHAKWPEAGFDYFLAQMRRPGQTQYVPTLLWGLTPIDPQRAKPPAAPSYVAPERGFALLRAEESPAHWESTAPAVALQFATLYVHYVADCFSLLGYHAFQRPIYLNRPISAGYNGGPYDFHVRSHCGVVVDGLQAQPIGPVPTRVDFHPLCKTVFIRTAPPSQGYTGKELRSTDQPKTGARQVYPGVELARGLMLTRDYLFDVFRVASAEPRQYHWLVHALGEAKSGQDWPVSDELQNTLFNTPEIRIGEARRYAAGDREWELTTLQTRHGSGNRLGDAWYARQVGVRVRMLGEPGTTVFHYRPPLAYAPGTSRSYKPGQEPQELDETGGVSIAVARQAPQTVFVALHEPFEAAAPVTRFSRVAQTAQAVVARVDGAGWSDRLLLRFDDQPDEPVTLTGAGESFTFARHGYVRIAQGKLEVAGGVRAARVRAGAGWLEWPAK